MKAINLAASTDNQFLIFIIEALSLFRVKCFLKQLQGGGCDRVRVLALLQDARLYSAQQRIAIVQQRKFIALMMQADASVSVPEGHFAVNVPLPGVVLPELIIRREAEAAMADIGALVLSTVRRDDGSFVVKVSVAKKFAISLYSREHAGEKVPEAKAVGAAMVRHAAELIVTRLKSSIDSARAAAESNPPEGEGRQEQLRAPQVT